MDTTVIIILLIIICLASASAGVGGYYYYNQTPAAATAPTGTAASGNSSTAPTGTAASGNSSTPPPALAGSEDYALGHYGMLPWGSASNFVDPSAQWIWNIATAATTAPMSSVKFSTQFNNTTGSAIQAVLHILVDDSATVSLNGTQVGTAAGGWTSTNYSKIPMTLVTGNNIITIDATNAGGPAGLLASLVQASNSSEVLLRTGYNTFVSSPG